MFPREVCYNGHRRLLSSYSGIKNKKVSKFFNMANQQLLDYIKQQLQLGVAKEAVQEALLGSGWPKAEVEEAMGAVGGPAASTAVAAKPAATTTVANMAASVSAKPGAASPTSSPTATKPASSSPLGGGIFQSKGESVFKPMSAVSASTKSLEDIGHPSNPHHWLLPAILGVVVVILLGGLWWLYTQNMALSNQIKSSMSSNGSLVEQLNQQVASLTADKASLTNQVTSLTNSNKDTLIQLSLFSVSTSTAEESITLSGTVSGTDKAGYVLTTTQQILVNIKNYKDAKLAAALKVLGSQAVVLAGTFMPGSHAMTVTTINGATPEAFLAAQQPANPTPPATTSSTVPALPTSPSSTKPTP